MIREREAPTEPGLIDPQSASAGRFKLHYFGPPADAELKLAPGSAGASPSRLLTARSLIRLMRSPCPAKFCR
jgi:hypothetical protein